MPIIDKYLNDSFILIETLNAKKAVVLQVGKTKNHTLNSRPAFIEFDGKKYNIRYKTIVPIGIQNHKELKIRRQAELLLENKNIKIYAEGKNVIPTNISIPGFDNPNFDNRRLKKLVVSNISALSTVKKSYYKTERLYRAIIPLSKEVRLFGSFTGWSYNVDDKRYFETLMKLEISGFQFDFYTIIKDKKYYFVVDSKQKHKYDNFMRFVNSVLLSYGFLKGDYHGEQAYILSYRNKKLKEPQSLKTIILGGGLYHGFLIHTTNPYNVQKFREQNKVKKDKDGKIIANNDHLKKYMVEFPAENFSKLCELIESKGGILRSVILFVSNHSTTLEMKIPILYVALENITKAITGSDVETPKLIDNEKIEKEIKKEIKEVAKNINKIKRDNLSPNLTEVEKKDYGATFERILNKFHNFNKGTNNKKLTEPFSLFGYKLTKEEEDLILIHRNKFLHGDDFSDVNLNYEYEFRELFHISLKLEKLIAILLLKASGYNGYILNNAKIYEYISEKSLKENELIII
jgi:hypothetical protein